LIAAVLPAIGMDWEWRGDAATVTAMNQPVTDTDLPDDIDALKALVAQHRGTISAQEAELTAKKAELTAKKAELTAQQAELTALHEQLRLMLARRFGASSERASDAQLGLFNEAEQDAQAVDDDEDSPVESDVLEVPAHSRKRPTRKPLSAELPRVNVVHDLAEAEKNAGDGADQHGKKADQQIKRESLGDDKRQPAPQCIQRLRETVVALRHGKARPEAEEQTDNEQAARRKIG